MKFLRPRGILAGFSWTAPDRRSWPAWEAGEQWVPGNRTIGEHANSGWEVYFQPEGRSRWKCGRASFSVGPGGYYVMAPGARHRLVAFEPCETHFFYAVLPGPLDWPAPFASGGGAYSLDLPFRGLIRELSLDTPHRREAMAAYASALRIEVSRLLSGSRPGPPEIRRHPAVARACELLENHPGARWRLDELAALSGVSKPHLAALFRRETGRSPHQFLLDLRIERADELLRSSDRPITQIALDLGFSSSQHFSTSYRKARNSPPKSMRLPATPPAKK